MALIQCTECGKQISDKATSCPGCGAPGMAQRVEPTPTRRTAANEPIELENGKWAWGGMEFNSPESAKMFAKSRQLGSAPDSRTPEQQPVSDEDRYGHTFPGMKSAETKKMGPLGWMLTLGFAALIGSCVFGGSSNQSASTSRASSEFSESTGLSLCKQAIRLVSRDPDKAEIPYATPSRIGPDYVYTWTPGVNTIRLRNGLGLDVPASARCAVNAALGQISKLDVNGNTIVH